jgi:hypothetical protein
MKTVKCPFCGWRCGNIAEETPVLEAYECTCGAWAWEMMPDVEDEASEQAGD